MKSNNWLNEVLENREARVEKQTTLRKKYNLPVLSLTINIPGEIKKTPEALVVFEAALSCIEGLGINIAEKILTCKKTGYEALFCLHVQASQLKKLTCKIEESHPLGRLMDIDVIGEQGHILSRKSPRKCFVCEENAKVCARARKHSLSELSSYIKQKIDDYQASL
ncbi:MAG TPA: citrate lyase holo-[acyl-carrier protein] synthase [Sulfurospirillum sp. UBA11407]|nr:MAG TPA: citrate lyase holo-[acyl-carrier protein] synthase [Sulfurospirillum sp. UBA11407]